MRIKKITALISAAAIFLSMLVPVTVSYAAPKTITVGKNGDYQSIHEAVAAAKELNPQSEADRVTINVDPGDYEEQVVFDNDKYITLQQTPKTTGRVNLHWYYCTGYAAANCDFSGKYNSDIDWYAHPPRDGNGKTYEIGKPIPAGTYTYETVSGETKTETIKAQELGNTGGLDKMATLIIRNNSENITIKDLNIVNSVPVFATQGEKDAHLTPLESYPNLPDRSKLANCTEDTAEEALTAVTDGTKGVTKAKYDEYVKTHTLTAGQSVWLSRAGVFNERGHAVSFYSGDKITFENIRLRAGQDSLYAAGGRVYFKNCDLIGGTDYIYGGATAVFDHCKLGLEGFSDKQYGSPIATGGHNKERKYGYLFYECTLYNVRDNNGTNNYGGPWQAGSQIVYFNCVLDDNGTVGNSNFVLVDKGWDRFGAEKGLSRSYEYGTTNKSGKAVDFSKRIVNKSVEEGGTGMGTVLTEWEVLEFNPRNYFSKDCDKAYTDDWDPMGFASNLTDVDAEIDGAAITVPKGEETVINLPTSKNNDIEFHWVSASNNAVVSDNEKTITIIRPAAGMPNIETSVILYAKKKGSDFGDKKEIPVTIMPTTNTTDVFNIPVTVTQSATDTVDNEYVVNITKDGALIKKQTITIPSGQTTKSETIENVPATAGSGIKYNVSVLSISDEFTVVEPTDGKKEITGVTGQNVNLAVTAQKVVDETIDTGISYNKAEGNKTYDLIALAKANGAGNDLTTSSQITVSYKLDVKTSSTGSGFIDLLSGTPTGSATNSALPSRFVLAKLGHWNQLDMVDNTTGFSGSSDGPHQYLNACGKFDTKTISNVAITIDYKNKTISVKGSGSNKEATYSFEPSENEYEKGKLNMAVYPGSENFSISGVTLTYKKVRTTADATSYKVSIADPDNNPEVKIMDGENAVTTMTADVNSTVTVRVEIGKEDAVISTNPVSDIVLDETKSNEQYKYYTFKMPTNNTTIKVQKIEYVEPESQYGKVVDNEDGSKTFYFGTESISQSNNQAKIVSDTVNGVSLLRPDYFYPGSNGYGELKMSELNLKNSGYNKVDVVLANRDTSDIVIKVGGTQVAAKTGVTTGDWSPYQTFTLDLTETEAEGNVTIESTVTSGQFCGNFAYLRFYGDGVIATTPPTSAPDNKAAVKDVKIETGNTVVRLNNISEGVVIAAKYDDSALTDVKTKDIAGNTVTIEGIEADKIMVWNSLKDMKSLCGACTVDKSGTPTTNPTTNPTSKPLEGTVVADFTTMSAVPEYSAASGQGFVTKSSAIMPSGYERQVAPASAITISSDGAKITETTGSYLHKKNNSDDGDDYNNGGLIYRIDTGKAGAYHLEVEIAGTSAETIVAPTGMNGGGLTGTSNWDNCLQVPRTVSAKWNNNVWSYDFATGENFVEIEIEPKTLASASNPQTVGVKKITLTPLANNNAGDKPTIHILGDSTQKSYSFDETISAWGQTLKNYFDTDKVNVVNYSMGGRAMKSNYCEGRFDEILIRGKQGDFVFIHSAHNDETVSKNRFSRGAGTEKDNFTVNDANYNRWLDMYVEAIKARGMTPVLVTAMPRVNGSTGVPNSGFNPNSPANMRAKAKSDPDVALAELYDGAKAYIAKLDGKEAAYIYNNIEAGEVPAANAANGAKGDGTHYKEAAAKQWSRIILQSIYDQSVASTDTYTDKDIMTNLVSLMPEKVKTAAKTGNWSEVFPEMASDVSAVDIVPGAEKQAESNYYYRNNIEKALQLGLLHKDTSNMFKPTATITVGEFARGIEKAFGLEKNSLTSYTKTYAELTAETASVNLMSADNIAEADAYDNDIELMAEGDGKFTITVNQSAGGTVTVYNNSAFNTATVDIPAGVTASSIISDNDHFTLTAPETITDGTDNSGAMADGISKNYVEFRNGDGKIFTYTAKADGIITVYARTGNNKSIELKGTTTQAAYINEAGSGNVYGVVTFNVKSGETYELYTRGGSGRLFGVKYESTNYPQSTESLTVNSGDEIRVVATPAENHVNGSILVNGKAESTSKEYTFKIEGNTTVSATFISEPVLVEVTRIASDAALTREAMGAILYDAYQAFQKNGSNNAKEYMARYMNNNGGIPSPSDPNYDPNIQYEGSPYIPTVGWGALTDTNDLADSLYMKVKNAYNLGLMRSEQGIGRGKIALGTELEPKAKVTRAKAAKTLVFAFTLTQKPNDESQLIPSGYALSTPSEIALPNAKAQTTVFN